MAVVVRGGCLLFRLGFHSAYIIIYNIMNEYTVVSVGGVIYSGGRLLLSGVVGLACWLLLNIRLT